jgi:hypothetical protein
MSTPSRQRAGSARRFSAPTGRTAGRAGRAQRPSARPRRQQTTTHRGAPFRRSQPQQSGVQKALSQVTEKLPGIGGGKARRSRFGRTSSSGGGKKGTAGLALLAGAAGLAMKNRDKIGGMFGRKSQGGSQGEPQGGSQGEPQGASPNPNQPPTTTPPPPAGF